MAAFTSNRVRARLALATALALGTVGTGAMASPLDLSSGSAGFFNTPAAGGFTDTYTFTLTTAASLSAMVTSAVGGTQDVDFTAWTLVGPAGVFSMSLAAADPFETWTLSTPVLAPGSYTLTGTGANSPAIGTYAGNLALSVNGAAPAAGSGGPLDLSSGSVGFVNTPASGAFTDIYTFTVTTAATLRGIVSSAVGGTQDLDFASLVLAGPSGVFSMTNASADPFERWVIDTGVLAPGSYTLTATGANSAAIGTYVGNFALSASDAPPITPVPEPETFALMLAGLGALHLAVRRRQAGAARRQSSEPSTSGISAS